MKNNVIITGGYTLSQEQGENQNRTYNQAI